MEAVAPPPAPAGVPADAVAGEEALGWLDPLTAAPLPPADSEVGKDDFVVVQWNVLADGLDHDGSWFQRKDMILAEVFRRSPDIICLQEVNHFADHLEPVLRDQGFEGVFAPKANSPALKFGKPMDGCATFINTIKFTLLRHQRFVYSGYTQVFQLCFLRANGSGSRGDAPDLIVCNTHLKSKRHYEPWRVDQITQLLRTLQGLQVEFPQAQFILAGDLNTTPTGRVRGRIASSTKAPMLSSAFATLESSSHANFFTRLKRDGRTNLPMTQVIDHILFSGSGLQVRAILPPPVVQDLFRVLPDAGWPSDHLALAARFRGPWSSANSSEDDPD
ncbi:Nocturnin (Carbon catabolite repression 4-like protein) [Durusdinium trenchii]|uniref:Nocturnin (Carbon catabolite repression 4-like protein) n=1 Tax=Durusdinium trenchii TaxID=1381693 RepID=A0ABP0MRD8_9DINO